jgi:dolichol kinase
MRKRGRPDGADELRNYKMIERENINYKAELIRKGIHLCSLSIPVAYYFISRDQALRILVPLTLVFLIVDLLRYYHKPTAVIFYKMFGVLLRGHEQDGASKRLNGATHVFISATLCIIIFPKLITVTCFSILIISDSAAALIGRRFGRHRFLSKSVEGSLAFFITALAVVMCAPKIFDSPGEYAIAAVAAAVGTIIEASSIRIDDNLSIPISIGAIMWLLYLVFYPASYLQSLVFAR